MWWPWVQYPAEKSTTHLLSHFGTSFACHHLFCNDYPFLRQGLIQQIRLNLFRSVTTCREMSAQSNDLSLIGHKTIYFVISLVAKYSSKSLTLTWWLGCLLALWIHFICQSWYLWKVIQALEYGWHFRWYKKIYMTLA